MFAIPKRLSSFMLIISLVIAAAVSVCSARWFASQLLIGLSLDCLLFAIISATVGWQKAFSHLTPKGKAITVALALVLITFAWLPLAIVAGINGSAHAIHECACKSEEKRINDEAQRAYADFAAFAAKTFFAPTPSETEAAPIAQPIGTPHI